MGLLAEVGARLTAAGVASTGAGSTGWALRYRGLSPVPERQVAVTLSGGLQQEGRPPLDRPTFQVLIRGSSADSASLEAQVTAVDAALNLQSSQMTGWYYADIQRQGDAAFLGWDDAQRPLYSLNYLALRSRTS